MAKKKSREIADAVEWYSANRSTYEALAVKVAEILQEILNSRGIEYYNITHRPKDVKSFREKAMKGEYSDPTKEIKDLAGVRVITYVESEARKVGEIVEATFKVNRAHSIDKSKTLGIDKMGYRSVHYVAGFTAQRCKLPEFKRFTNAEFEIQVRTVLQHAWAEIEHDRNYKYTGKLPDEIQRRFSILAGMLEFADSEFDRVSLEIDSYISDISDKTEKGDLDIEINTTALREFLNSRFKDAVNAGLKPLFGFSNQGAVGIVDELRGFGIRTLRDLDEIIPADFEKKTIEGLGVPNNFQGVLRDLMIINDADRYFENAWNQRWTILDEATIKFYESYGIDAIVLVKKYRLEVGPNPPG